MTEMKLIYRDRGMSGTQLEVLSGEVVIATLWRPKLSVSGRGEDWRWTFALTAGPAGFHHQGSAKSQQEAMVALERSWQNWLRAAGLSANE